jgi:hypothetical protein
VVADEVQELAQETARATEDIARRVEAIQADTTRAIDAIGGISGVIGQINDYQLTIASALEEHTATTNEMSRSVQEAAGGSTEIATNTPDGQRPAWERRPVHLLSDGVSTQGHRALTVRGEHADTTPSLSCERVRAAWCSAGRAPTIV